mmetsp:Transcript_37848/g.68404  ORF Transcript_37848/g.68404 Transcript_37848/m.68404 type:complete len:239 (+) Transcript_37848:570-1286(+)
MHRGVALEEHAQIQQDRGQRPFLLCWSFWAGSHGQKDPCHRGQATFFSPGNAPKPEPPLYASHGHGLDGDVCCGPGLRHCADPMKPLHVLYGMQGVYCQVYQDHVIRDNGEDRYTSVINDDCIEALWAAAVLKFCHDNLTDLTQNVNRVDFLRFRASQADHIHVTSRSLQRQSHASHEYQLLEILSQNFPTCCLHKANPVLLPSTHGLAVRIHAAQHLPKIGFAAAKAVSRMIKAWNT